VITLYIEGVLGSLAKNDVPIVVGVEFEDGYTASDVVNVTVFSASMFDCDVDFPADIPSIELPVTTNLPNVRIQWYVSGDGSLNQAETFTNEYGFIENVLSLPTTVGSSCTVTAKIIGFSSDDDSINLPELTLKSGVLKRVCGVCGEITFDQTPAELKVPSDRRTERTLTVRFKDSFGNNIEGGCLLDWELEGFGTILDAEDSVSAEGTATVRVQASDIEEIRTLRVFCDAEVALMPLEVEKVQCSLSSSPSTLDLNNADTAEISATFPNVADGTLVRWYTSNGNLFNAQSTTYNGAVTTSLESSGARQETAIVLASVGNNLCGCRVPITDSGGLNLTIEYPVLVGDRNSNTAIVVPKLGGVGDTVNCYASTKVYVKATGSSIATVGVRSSHVNLIGLPNVSTDAEGWQIGTLGLDAQGEGEFTIQSTGTNGPDLERVSIRAQVNPTKTIDDMLILAPTQKVAILEAIAGQFRVAFVGGVEGELTEDERRRVSAQLFREVDSSGQWVRGISIVAGGDRSNRIQHGYRAALWLSDVVDGTSSVKLLVEALENCPVNKQVVQDDVLKVLKDGIELGIDEDMEAFLVQYRSQFCDAMVDIATADRQGFDKMVEAIPGENWFERLSSLHGQCGPVILNSGRRFARDSDFSPESTRRYWTEIDRLVASAPSPTPWLDTQFENIEAHLRARANDPMQPGSYQLRALNCGSVWGLCNMMKEAVDFFARPMSMHRFYGEVGARFEAAANGNAEAQ
jgi:hypothetical protein